METHALYTSGWSEVRQPMWDIWKLGFVGVQPLIFKSKLGIVLKEQFQTSYWYSRLTCFLIFELKKDGKSSQISFLKIHLTFQASKQELWINFREDVWNCQRKYLFQPLCEICL